MTGLFDGLETLIIISLLLLLYTPLITTLVLREARILDFIAPSYRIGGYFLIFLLLGIATFLLFSIYTIDGIFIFTVLNTLILLFCKIRKAMKARQKRQDKTRDVS